MDKIVLEFSDQDRMRMEALLMDSDGEGALNFLREVIKAKITAKQSRNLLIGESHDVRI
jgi:hypothetical protein